MRQRFTDLQLLIYLEHYCQTDAQDMCIIECFLQAFALHVWTVSVC